MTAAVPSDTATARVLCVPRAKLDELGAFDGFTPWQDRGQEVWLHLVLPSFAEFRPRAEVEDDPTWLQLIPYTVLSHRGRVFGYRRRPDAGDGRLRGRFSIGVGGHVEPGDVGSVFDDPDAWVVIAAAREVREELGYDPKGYMERLGLILDESNPVGRVHLGLAFLRESIPLIQPPLNCEFLDWRVEPPARWLATDGLESWSRIVLEELVRREGGPS